jgi:hypothetical protein
MSNNMRAFLIFATLLCVLPRPSFGANELVAQFSDVPVKTASGATPAAAEVRDAIIFAGRTTLQAWSIADAGPGKLVGRIERQNRRRTHIVMVEILYSPQSYSVSYLNSTHMNYAPAEKTIHPNYNVWVGELVTNINRNLAALTPGAPAGAVAAVPSAPAAAPTPGLPQAGDTWTYRATHIRRRGEMRAGPATRTHVVRVAAASASEIVEELVIDGAPAPATTHVKGAYLLSQGVAIFSPHLGQWGDLSQPGSLGSIEILDPGCRSTHICQARAKIVGTESIRVPAGTFTVTRILVEQSWAAASSSTQSAAQFRGSRTLTVWYSPELKRAIKYSSRVGVGDVPPMDPHFDLELVSYQLK